MRPILPRWQRRTILHFTWGVLILFEDLVWYSKISKDFFNEIGNYFVDSRHVMKRRSIRELAIHCYPDIDYTQKRRIWWQCLTFLNWDGFIVWNLSQILIGKTLLDQKLKIVSDQQTLSLCNWDTFFSLKISQFWSFQTLQDEIGNYFLDAYCPSKWK